MPELTAQPKSAPEALSDSDTDSDPEQTAACEISAQLQEMVDQFAAQQRILSEKVAGLDAWQAACSTPSAMLAAQWQDACDALANLAQRHAKMTSINLEFHEVWLQKREDGATVQVEQATVVAQAWLAQHQAWLAEQQDVWI